MARFVESTCDFCGRGEREVDLINDNAYTYCNDCDDPSKLSNWLVAFEANPKDATTITLSVTTQ